MGRFGAVRDALPQVTRKAGFVLVGEWVAGSPVRQAAAADAAVAAWGDGAWPEGLASRTAFVSTDGTSVLHWSQGAHASVFAASARRAGEWLGRVDDVVPGLARGRATGVVPYRRVEPDAPSDAASGGADGGADPVGCLAIAEFEVAARPGDGRAEALVDAVVAASGTDMPPGLVSANFFVSADGTRIVDYAEWVDGASHEAFSRAASVTLVAEVVEGAPEVRFLGVRRYDWWRTALPPAGPGDGVRDGATYGPAMSSGAGRRR